MSNSINKLLLSRKGIMHKPRETKQLCQSQYCTEDNNQDNMKQSSIKKPPPYQQQQFYSPKNSIRMKSPNNQQRQKACEIQSPTNQIKTKSNFLKQFMGNKIKSPINSKKLFQNKTLNEQQPESESKDALSNEKEQKHIISPKISPYNNKQLINHKKSPSMMNAPQKLIQKSQNIRQKQQFLEPSDTTFEQSSNALPNCQGITCNEILQSIEHLDQLQNQLNMVYNYKREYLQKLVKTISTSGTNNSSEQQLSSLISNEFSTSGSSANFSKNISKTKIKNKNINTKENDSCDILEYSQESSVAPFRNKNLSQYLTTKQIESQGNSEQQHDNNESNNATTLSILKELNNETNKSNKQLQNTMNQTQISEISFDYASKKITSKKHNFQQTSQKNDTKEFIKIEQLISNNKSGRDNSLLTKNQIRLLNPNTRKFQQDKMY